MEPRLRSLLSILIGESIVRTEQHVVVLSPQICIQCTAAPGPTLYFGARRTPLTQTPVTVYTCYYKVMAHGQLRPLCLPLRMLWLAQPCRCVTLQLLCVTSSLSSLYQLVILVPPACDCTSLFIIFTRVLLSSFIVLSSNLNVSL